ncbi:hypothetical protein GIY62_35480 (plasmid) [Burkholderia plantarii]|uniref:hypothetical protein n=1 Tax=Burkholderia plantarii TaxID=41899 RepID=UPI00272AB9DD|nr:hypothetical protein [Burkholderia plantarii]WLE64162.1 hypothetical protein GIY62_35480 [Burkholderia plantarii]
MDSTARFAPAHARVRATIRTIITRFLAIAGTFAILAIYVGAKTRMPELAAAFVGAIAAAMVAVETFAPNRGKLPVRAALKKVVVVGSASAPGLLIIALGLGRPDIAVAAALGVCAAVWMNETTDW